MRLIEEHGYDSFSLRELAARLNVKPASLYNHFDGLGRIRTAVGAYAAESLNAALAAAVENKGQKRAFIDGTDAYRQFAKKNPQLYKALMRMPPDDDEAVVRAAFSSIEPLRRVIKSYGAPTAYTVHFLRRLRAEMHGFAELDSCGFLQRGSLTTDSTYRVMQLTFLRELRAAARRNRSASERNG